MVRRGTSYEALSLAIRSNSIKKTKYILNKLNGLIIDDTWTDYILLIKALQRGRIHIAKLLLKSGCRVNKEEKTNFFHTPLYYAVRLGNVSLIKLLLKKGALINNKDSNRDSPLCLAFEKKFHNIVDILLSQYLDEVEVVNNNNNDDCIAFEAACSRNDVFLIETFVNKGILVNEPLNLMNRTFKHFYPIHLAVLYQNLDVVKLLLNYDVDVDVITEMGETALHIAQHMRANRYPSKNSLEIIDTILSEIKKGNKNCEDRSGLTYFHIACTRDQPDVVEHFLKQNVNINISIKFDSANWPGYTGLHFAIENKQRRIINLLFNHGADSMIKNTNGETPFHFAFSNFYFDHELIDSILSKYILKNENPINKFGLSHFHIACSTNNAKAIEDFLSNGVSINDAVSLDSSKCPGYTPIHFAVNFNQIEAVKVLLEHGADTNSQEYRGFTPLHMACQQDAKKIHTIIRNSIGAPMEKQLNFQSEFKKSPIKMLNGIAEQNEQVKIVDLLLLYLSNVDSKDYLGKTPLFYAWEVDHETLECEFGNNMNQAIHKILNEFYIKRKRIIETLLKYNPDLNVYDNNRKTVLHCITETNKTFRDDGLVEICDLLLMSGADINCRDQTGSTPVHIALKKGYVNIINVFLEYKVNPNLTDNINEQNLLHLAVLNDLLAPSSERIIRGLLKKGANIDARQFDGQTSLHIAASTRCTTVRLIPLLELDCDIDSQDKMGRTPLHMACINRNAENVRHLLDHGADINILDEYNFTPFYYYYQYQVEILERSIRDLNQIYYIFKNHIRKLDTLGFFINWENMSYYMDLNDLNIERANNNDILLQCEGEIKRMKSIKINSYSTLYDILFKDPNEMALYIKNENLKNIIALPTFKNDFLHYSYLIELQFKRGYNRKELLKPAKEALSVIIGINLPDSCSERIFRFLSNRNLKDLIEAQETKKM